VVLGHTQVIEETAQAIGFRRVAVYWRQEPMTIDDDRQCQGLCRALSRELTGRRLIRQREPQQVSRNVEDLRIANQLAELLGWSTILYSAKLGLGKPEPVADESL